MDPVPTTINVGRQPTRTDIAWTHIIYALHGFGVGLGVVTSAFIVTSFIFGIPSIVAVILNYVKQGDVRGTWLESHFRWQIRTFWYALLWVALASLLSLPLMLVLVGFLTLWLAAVLVGLWVLYRVVKGWVRLAAAQEMYKQAAAPDITTLATKADVEKVTGAIFNDGWAPMKAELMFQQPEGDLQVSVSVEVRDGVAARVTGS